jgi:hypothetical protein
MDNTILKIEAIVNKKMREYTKNSGGSGSPICCAQKTGNIYRQVRQGDISDIGGNVLKFIS